MAEQNRNMLEQVPADDELDALERELAARWRPVLLVAVVLAGLLAGLALSRLVAPAPVIGIVRLYDVIDYYTAPLLLGPLNMAADRRDIVAVVMLVDSPGGDATVSEEMFFTILSLREQKPVVASIERFGASGSYYAASAANFIIARPAAQVGSIGVISSFPTDSPPDEETYTTGPFKGSGRSSVDFMRDVELIKQVFLSHVYDQRSYALEHMHTPSRQEVLPPRDLLATGQVWVGTRAYQIGLVDALGSNEDAILKAAELAGVSHYQVVDLLATYLEQDDEYMGYYLNADGDWYENGPWVELYHLYQLPDGD